MQKSVDSVGGYKRANVPLSIRSSTSSPNMATIAPELRNILHCIFLLLNALIIAYCIASLTLPRLSQETVEQVQPEPLQSVHQNSSMEFVSRFECPPKKSPVDTLASVFSTIVDIFSALPTSRFMIKYEPER
ncbi:hypothetical protein NEOLI_005018 [Neolecta irregularis DAH-3]|uniref:Uncharacterized protein n=1 Tax=Neolecta irregularis (strain DAH-3) TaxID=1198029 RepID=A0A1U7LN26_NEOID|nr:hypothetical protein NEOLI_005018 [Neolecta irregularis DAH-3]|eukprot:OLL24028.1 hypothetical protein NEOLI_005018 [Neolecta irregularis DAH-3]